MESKGVSTSGIVRNRMVKGVRSNLAKVAGRSDDFS